MPSRIRDEFHTALRAAANTDAWTVLDGNTVRWTETLPTPGWVSPRQWPEPQYKRHLFITATSGQPIVRIASAPWVEARDHFVPLRRALELVRNPRSAFTQPAITPEARPA
ncbi:hypothetical protein [Amycolatopsis thermophila]|uniref:Uncharacterized protein n=1 Tax=Amycolatopsis thermophila TaxID=206084 RepID=A0ABU0EMS7_9PSEU|nr:hypothetical protein [Amycolatopsis thermophila]MDQ0376572.1 hypothetical protein [Amycolatopsis thermophila]